MEKTKFLSLIDEMIKNHISDLHLATDTYPYIRDKVGSVVPVESFGILNEQDMSDVIMILLDRKLEENTVDRSFEHGGERFRVNISRTIHGETIAMRTIPSLIPEPTDIGLPEWLIRATHSEKGIILLTGPTGSGKSTTMAALIEYINRTMRRHIITLEDPVEFVYKNKLSLVNQRELGKHFATFPDGIRSILREDPDVIVIGEMRDFATMEAAITLAETGHLVFSTLHTNDTVQTVDRIIQSFPADAQNQIRTQFALAMRAIVAQMLLPKADNSGKVVVREIMFNNDSIRNLIIRGETQHMYSVLEISKQDGMVLMDDAIMEHYRAGTIGIDTAKQSIRDVDRLASLQP